MATMLLLTKSYLGPKGALDNFHVANRSNFADTANISYSVVYATDEKGKHTSTKTGM